ncbi:hypothetical protein RYH73_20265 [Olivibacter sp. CPCC 100613]|uniref:hypothetical protein n=1 Tax=Olivibacter sp. CPCC 100613 TaxID=3079931 RepID=UPI002FFCD96E
MKTAKFITLCLMLLSIFTYSEALAQHGRGRGHGREREHRGHDYRRGDRDHYRHDRGYYKKSHKHYNKQVRYYEKHRRQRYYGYPRWAHAHRYRARHHVYFRDYCTFYDPYRGGYVYWSSNRWIFSQSVPAFLANVDLGSARIQLMANIPLERHPEYYYEEYARSYPRSTSVHINLSLPPF